MSRADRRAAMRRLLLSSLHGRGRDVRALCAWSLVEALPAFLSGLLVARAIDKGFLAGDAATGFAWLGVLALAVVVGGWATRQTFLRLAALVEPFRDELARRTVHGALQRSIATGAPAHTAGVARLTQQVEIVRAAYAGVLLVVQAFLVSAGAALLGLVTLAPRVLLLVLPPLAVALGLFLAALPGMAARRRASILADEGVAEGASTVVGGLRDVVACGAEEQVAAGVGEHIDAQARATTELARFTAVRTVAIGIGGRLPLVLILAAGPWLVRNGTSTGQILGALTYVSQGVHPALSTLTRGLGNVGLWLFVTLARIVEETEVAPPEPRAGGEPAPRGHDVRLRGVTFGYGRASEPVIRGLDLVVAEGDHLAVVGPSGAGKSTLAGLIAGLLEPQQGEVVVGGLPVGRIDREAAAQHRVLIPQEAYVFAGTLRENLTYLSPGATTAEVDDAVDRLGVGALVARLGGYDAELDAAELSAGERQLITLVRAYVAPARLTILDEATCHLDPAAEARVERAFAARGGTLLIIAHRISSALRARRVLVLDGRQALLGDHDELLLRSALYRDLVGHWGVPAAEGGATTAPVNGARAAGRARL
ncbi:MAG: ATP-binding cassette, subfamily bacterial RamB/AmfA [Solirubrobacteraceae bacterium]|jgi:ATP-binding cassette subfamily C protein|nr:ATP-binding cassette, subfamily bacterial RamB/AmfA [Solirubrobacteraceae bacterium]